MVRGWPWLMLAACSSQGSIELVVTAPGLSVKNVELFIGVHDEHLEAIRPQHGPLADAVWWKRDRSLATDLQPLGDDGEMRYQLVNGGSLGDSLAAFVVVGYDETDAPIAVRSHMIWTDISDDQIDRYEFVLGGAQPIPGTSDMPGVLVWGPSERSATSSTERRDADPHACVQVDSVEELAEYKGPDGKLPKSGMIVSPGDPDCDGLLETAAPDFECLDHEYMGQGRITREALKCAIKTAFVDAGGPVLGCLVGGGACVDGMRDDSSSSCAPSAYCMPSPACNQCPAAGCDPYNPPAGTPYISCEVYAPDNATAGSDFCAGASVLDVSTVPGFSVTCDPTRPAMLRKDRTTAWLQSYPIENDVTANTSAYLDVLPAAGNCRFEFKATGPVPRNNINQPISEFGGTLSIPFGPTLEGRGLMIPIAFRVVPPPNNNLCESSQPPACTLKTVTTPYVDRGLQNCVAAPVAPGSQVTD